MAWSNTKVIPAGAPPPRHSLTWSEEKLPDVGCFCSGSLVGAPQLRGMLPSSSCDPLLPDGWQALHIEDWRRTQSWGGMHGARFLLLDQHAHDSRREDHTHADPSHCTLITEKLCLITELLTKPNMSATNGCCDSCPCLPWKAPNRRARATGHSPLLGI